MEGLATLIVVVAVFVANLPALREQWRTDRAGSIKTIWMFGVYCLCRARDRGPASARAKDRRARRRRQGAYPHRLHGRLDFLWRADPDARCAALPRAAGLAHAFRHRGSSCLAPPSPVAFEGIEARPIDVRVQIGPGLPAFIVVGLPDKAPSAGSGRGCRAIIFAHQFLRFPKNKVMPEAELRQLLHDHGFTISHMSYRQNDKGAVFEYRMVIGTVDQQNPASLATTLHKTKDILEFRISPAGD